MVKLNSPLCWFYDANHGFPDSLWTSPDNPDKKQIQTIRLGELDSLALGS